MRYTKIVFVGIFTLVSFSNACFINFAKNEIKSFKSKNASINSVEKFNQRLNEKKFEEICDETSDYFKQNITNDNCLRFFEAVNKNLGIRKKAVLQETHWKPEGDSVWLNYDTDFELDKGYEEIGYQTKGEYPKIESYHVYTNSFNSDVILNQFNQ